MQPLEALHADPSTPPADPVVEELDALTIFDNETHGLLLLPLEPTKSPLLKHGPHVCDTELHASRFNAAQFGVPEQFTLFSTELRVEIACFVPSGFPLLLLNWLLTRELRAEALTVVFVTVTEMYTVLLAL